jgi:hypothetical protein
MSTKSYWKNWAEMIRAPAGPGVNLRNAVFGAGLYDGARRDHFFQRVERDTGEILLPQWIANAARYQPLSVYASWSLAKELKLHAVQPISRA